MDEAKIPKLRFFIRTTRLCAPHICFANDGPFSESCDVCHIELPAMNDFIHLYLNGVVYEIIEEKER